jgi:hypothetical protein
MHRAELLTLAKDPRHWRFFREFCVNERAVGGPDPHMATVAKMSERVKPRERVWRAGCYIGVYNVPAAEAIWRHWTAAAVQRDPLAFEEWLQEHWAGLPLRRERKAVRSPRKLARCLVSYAEWSENLPVRRWWTDETGTEADRYEAAWATVTQDIYGVGRYVALKLLEFYTRYLNAPILLPDLRPAGGWSPKEALVLLYPEHVNVLLGREDVDNNEMVNRVAGMARRRLRAEGIDVSRYVLQVLLCDYKQSYAGRRQYPGRSLDSEIEYTRTVETHFGYVSAIWNARRALFPPQALGEVQGWPGVRKELGTVMRDHGYVWTDLAMDYLATEDLRAPVWRL